MGGRKSPAPPPPREGRSRREISEGVRVRPDNASDAPALKDAGIAKQAVWGKRSPQRWYHKGDVRFFPPVPPQTASGGGGCPA